MWADVLVSMQTHLAANLGDTEVKVGGYGAIPNVQTVYLQRGPGDITSVRKGSYKGTLWIECWTRNDDEQAGYLALDALEQELIAQLLAWSATVEIPGWNVKLNLTTGGIDPDGGAFLPAHGSRMTIAVTASRRRASNGTCGTA